MPIPLRSVSRAILDWLPPGPLQGWTVLSVHRRACNLRSPQGAVLGLVSPELGNGPFHAVLERPVDFAWLAQGLTQGGLTLDLAGATPWDPWLGERELGVRSWKLGNEGRRTKDGSGHPVIPSSRHLVPPPSHPAIRFGHLVIRSPGLLLRSPCHSFTSSSPHPLTRALRSGDPAQLHAAVLALAGRGPGLTPAGDDFLLGIMAGLWLFPQELSPRWSAPEACRRIAEWAAPRTTTLSGAWLRYAGQGAFSQPWHALARALAQDDPARLAQAVDGILAVGATSGQDALTGFLAWMTSCIPAPAP